MVALNYQTNDLAYEINVGKFMENGNCGYVLKPEYMRLVHSPTPRPAPYTLVIHIISGQQLPKPNGATSGEIVDPFVIVHVNAPPPLNSHEYKTKTVSNNGFNPVWNEVLIWTTDSGCDNHIYGWMK